MERELSVQKYSDHRLNRFIFNCELIMPLSTGTSNAAREKNVQTEISAGKDPRQAVAISYSKQRENRAAKDAINRLHPHIKGLRDCLAKVAKVVKP